ncbi:MAG: hypothetical protein H0T84_01630 [Tatlockia sp.]|nr:hypothetical protein [Tatlockia sp.]
MRKYSVLFAASAFLIASTGLASAQTTLDQDNISRLVRFLVSDRMLTLNANAQLIPLSFFVGTEEDISAYFGDYICTKENSCAVYDTIYSSPFAILPLNRTEREWRAAQAQIERTELKYGTDIYHAATWQIALALAAQNGFLDKARARKLIANQLETITNPVNRATGFTFRYGSLQPIFAPSQAFTFRRLSSNFYNKDPFFNSRYRNYINMDFDFSTASRLDPLGFPPAFYSYKTTWADHKPLTGKNAWAQLIGPLQAESLLNEGTILVTSPALMNAMNTLTAFSLMQAGIGAFYCAPSGTYPNL